jgi:hypothetical protein
MIPEWVKVEGIGNNTSICLVKTNQILSMELVRSSLEKDKEIVAVGVWNTTGGDAYLEFKKDRYNLENLITLFGYFESKASFEPTIEAPVSRPAFAE